MAVTPETYPDSAVFVNKLGITDSYKLRAAETDFSTLQYELYRINPPPPAFNLQHLKAIHKQLFGNIYAWAGELRSFDIRKGICEFTPHADIEFHATKVYEKLHEQNYLQGLSLQDTITHLADYYDLTNKLHPFPEGNGRTQRLFIEHLAAGAGYFTDWSQIHPWEVIEVAVQSFEGNFEPTISMFEKITMVMPVLHRWKPQS